MLPFPMNKHLIANYDLLLNKAIPNKWDAFMINFGGEGTGKSTKSFQDAIKLDPDFNLKKVVFTPVQFDTGIEKAKPEAAIVWDESVTGAMSSAWSQIVTIKIIQKLTQIRKKKLKIIINIPYLHVLHRYFVARAICSSYIYAKGFDDRGYYKFYTRLRTENLYYYMKDVHKNNYRKAFANVAPLFPGRFNDYIPFDFDEYDAKKEAARLDQDGAVDKYRTYFTKTVNFIKENSTFKSPVSIGKLGKYLGISTTQLYKYVSELTNN